MVIRTHCVLITTSGACYINYLTLSGIAKLLVFVVGGSYVEVFSTPSKYFPFYFFLFFFASGPSSPRNISAEVLSSTSIRLKWIKPDKENGVIVNYEISYTFEGSNKESKQQVTGTTFEYSFVALRKFTQYHFVVRGNTREAGNASAVVSVKTSQDGEYKSYFKYNVFK